MAVEAIGVGTAEMPALRRAGHVATKLFIAAYDGAHILPVHFHGMDAKGFGREPASSPAAVSVL